MLEGYIVSMSIVADGKSYNDEVNEKMPKGSWTVQTLVNTVVKLSKKFPHRLYTITFSYMEDRYDPDSESVQGGAYVLAGTYELVKPVLPPTTLVSTETELRVVSVPIMGAEVRVEVDVPVSFTEDQAYYVAMDMIRRIHFS